MADDDVLLEKIANHYLFYGSFHSDLGLYRLSCNSWGINIC